MRLKNFEIQNLLPDIKEYLLATQVFDFHLFQLSSRKKLILAIEILTILITTFFKLSLF